MDIFNIVAGICSIVGLAVSIFAASKLVIINRKISSQKNQILNNKMRDNNIISGGDINGKQHKK
ncbi:MAG: hypothetical protein ACE3K2_28795 [Paenibacillus sp.]|uniref:hypothetical protein n=1 Tax=Paenibacillus sp. TaxID=58172 RepID=UPI003B78EB2B